MIHCENIIFSSLFFSPRQYKSILRELLYPDEICDQVEDISVDDLIYSGYTTIILDVDNTILAYEDAELTLNKHHWVDRLRANGWIVYLMSNNSSKKRIQKVSDQFHRRSCVLPGSRKRSA